MANRAGYKLGELLVRYLGVPLIPDKLTIKACRPLIDKITNKIKGWGAKTLRYAGKVQLVLSFLYSLAQLWMAIFILPKVVIKEIEKMCSDFLWDVGSNDRKMAVMTD
ncbi:unnamed protein product [Linum trigynum]|uniref:Reverse transcriptase n=1 Tax=Linum trigynum TaxID=586398 RepID=A0AAV2CIL6_9ROSI